MITNEEIELVRRSSGDPDALALLAALATDADAFEWDVPECERLAYAEAFARLAAANDDPDKLLLLADILCARAVSTAEEGGFERHTNEALAMQVRAMELGHPDAALAYALTLTTLSDGGNEAAAVALNLLMEAMTKAEAALLRTRVQQAAQPKGIVH